MQRIQKRRAGQRQTQNALIGLLSAVSMTRIGLTQLLPLCGSAAWWLSAACMLPGLCVYGAFRLLLRRTHTRTLTDCLRLSYQVQHRAKKGKTLRALCVRMKLPHTN